MELTEKTTMQAWKAALNYISTEGEDFIDHEQRVCREILNLCVVITDPTSDFEKPIDAMRSFDLVYPSTDELAAIIFSKDSSNMFEYSYGPRMFNYLGQKDQINDFIIPLLRKDPSSRRGVVSLFNPVKDLDIHSKNIPSLMFIAFKIKKGALHITCFIRSNDFFIGWPGNIYQIAILQRFVAEKLAVSIGSLTTISSSAHLFHEHFDMIAHILKK
ncbi:MAG: thymidylate synthase [Candidatus Woesearchaeota archaeon]